MNFQQRFEEARNGLRAQLGSQHIVELSVGGPAVGVARSTWHHLASEGKEPFPTARIGNKRYVVVDDLARFVAGKFSGLGEELPAPPDDLEIHLQRGEARRHGRPSRQEQVRAQGLGLTVKKLRELEASPVRGQEGGGGV
jgi:hypothetical protein